MGGGEEQVSKGSNIEDEDELLPIIERQLADKKIMQEDLAPQKKRGR